MAVTYLAGKRMRGTNAERIVFGWNSGTNIIDFSASNQYDNVQAFRDITESVRARESGRTHPASDFTGGYGLKQVKARLKTNGSPDGSVVIKVRKKSTHELLLTSNTISTSTLTSSIAVYTFDFELNKITDEIDIMVAMTGNTNGVNATTDISVGYTGETGSLSTHDDSDGNITTGWSYQTGNNARFTVTKGLSQLQDGSIFEETDTNTHWIWSSSSSTWTEI